MLKQNYSGYSLEAGTDEAGRGCLSGPVVAAAVILPANFTHPFLDGFKTIVREKESGIAAHYRRTEALAFGVSFVWQDEVDEINVLQASITGMHRSIEALHILPEFIIVDGNRFRTYKEIPHQNHCKRGCQIPKYCCSFCFGENLQGCSTCRKSTKSFRCITGQKIKDILPKNIEKGFENLVRPAITEKRFNYCRNN